MSQAMHAHPSANDIDHIVRFYEQDALLLDEVVEFADEALRCGGSAIIIASQPHLSVLTPLLHGLGAMRNRQPWFPGNLVALDADETLSRFMVDGWPDEKLFQATVGALVAKESRNHVRVHAFGEMVAILCEQGCHEAALRLEALWNDLARHHPFKLFCAYPHRVFADAAQAQTFRRVCEAHTHVSSTEARAARAAGDTDRLLAEWQQKAVALEHEVTRRREAETTLRRRERELTDFLDNAAEGLHRVDGHGIILWANAAELALLGYNYDEYVGRHIADFHVDQPVIDMMLARLQAGETFYDQPARLRCKDGSVKHVLIHSNGCFEDGKLLYTRCFTRDATDMMARRLAEQQRDAVLMQAPVAAALLTGPDHTVQLANKRYCAMLGRDDIVGLPLAQAVPELKDTGLLARLAHVYRSGKPFAAQEYPVELTGANGRLELRYFEFNLEPLRSTDGLVEGIIVVASEVTEHVRARQALEASHAQRELLLADLRQAGRAKDEFLAMLGHELRNPLSPIVTALQLMRMRGDTGTEREQNIIQRQVDHLVRLVDDLLDVSRITRGDIELKKETVRLVDVVTKAVEMASQLLEQRSHRLDLDVDRGLVWHGDPVRLAQAVANLLTNAARYTDVGGHIRLSARRDVAEAADSVVIRVQDNGTGIAGELLPRIFEPFFQAPRTIDRSEGGLGIGLALVKNLVELHGGRVGATSDGPGRGSEFTLWVPGVTAAPEAPQTKAGDGEAAAPPRRGSRRVLLVDDNVDSVQALAELLSVCGHQVHAVNDPVSAIQSVRDFAPDVAVLDIGLPVMDGYELIGHLREALGPHACRFVALTGYGQQGDRERTRAAGFAEHLVKPVPPEALLKVIEDQGGGSAGQRALWGDGGS
jgi:PAS domain S-box-containing protein